MVDNIRDAFRTAFKTSSWVTGDVRQVVIQKLTNMMYYVGSPGQRLEPASVEKYYDSVPDVAPDKFFNAWREARSVSCHRTWTDQKTWIFDETMVNAFYVLNVNTVVIPTAILQLPFFYTGAPPAINYGGIGTRKMKARQAVIDDTTDSENLADFAGCAIAHAAYASLPARQRKLTLPGLNLTAEHLFFVGHCAKWCENMRQTVARYAPGRSRCIVPLMNMVEFSDVFGCAPGTPMNPPKKCAFWS
ncbi:neprilysin-1 [Dermacentor silvarum]|uniref:neprilysin-1 n=1 Tax=Dermacentor silvarum TaxID=543639 RepID=UPI00189AADD9|nr:neprilysin-1 [Dermacentor silvarum]